MESRNFTADIWPSIVEASKVVKDEETSFQHVLEICDDVVNRIRHLHETQNVESRRSPKREVLLQFISLLVSRLLKHENNQGESQRESWTVKMVEFAGELLSCLRWMIGHAVEEWCTVKASSTHIESPLSQLEHPVFDSLVEVTRNLLTAFRSQLQSSLGVVGLSIQESAAEVFKELHLANKSSLDTAATASLSSKRIYFITKGLDRQGLITRLKNPRMLQHELTSSSNMLRYLIQSNNDKFNSSMYESIDLITEFIATSHFECLQYIDLLNKHQIQLQSQPGIIRSLMDITIACLQHSVIIDYWNQMFQPVSESSIGLEIILFDFISSSDGVSPNPPGFNIIARPSRFFIFWIDSLRPIATNIFNFIFSLLINLLTELGNEILTSLRSLPQGSVDFNNDDSIIKTATDQVSEDSSMIKDSDAAIKNIESLVLRIKEMAPRLAYFCSKFAEVLHLGLQLTGSIGSASDPLVTTNQQLQNIVSTNLQLLGQLVCQIDRLLSDTLRYDCYLKRFPIYRQTPIINCISLLTDILLKIYESAEVAIHWSWIKESNHQGNEAQEIGITQKIESTTTTEVTHYLYLASLMFDALNRIIINPLQSTTNINRHLITTLSTLADTVNVTNEATAIFSWIVQRDKMSEYTPTLKKDNKKTNNKKSNNKKLDSTVVALIWKSCMKHFRILKRCMAVVKEPTFNRAHEINDLGESTDELLIGSVSNLAQSVASLIATVWRILIGTSIDRSSQQYNLAKEMIEWFFILSTVELSEVNYTKMKVLKKIDGIRRLSLASIDRYLILSCWYELGRLLNSSDDVCPSVYHSFVNFCMNLISSPAIPPSVTSPNLDAWHWMIRRQKLSRSQHNLFHLCFTPLLVRSFCSNNPNLVIFRPSLIPESFQVILTSLSSVSQTLQSIKSIVSNHGIESAQLVEHINNCNLPIGTVSCSSGLSFIGILGRFIIPSNNENPMGQEISQVLSNLLTNTTELLQVIQDRQNITPNNENGKSNINGESRLEFNLECGCCLLLCELIECMSRLMSPVSMYDTELHKMRSVPETLQSSEYKLLIDCMRFHLQFDFIEFFSRYLNDKISATFTLQNKMTASMNSSFVEFLPRYETLWNSQISLLTSMIKNLQDNEKIQNIIATVLLVLALSRPETLLPSYYQKRLDPHHSLRNLQMKQEIAISLNLRLSKKATSFSAATPRLDHETVETFKTELLKAKNKITAASTLGVVYDTLYSSFSRSPLNTTTHTLLHTMLQY